MRWLVAGAVLIAVACLVRQLGLVLVPAILIGALPELRKRPGALVRVAAVLALPCVALAAFYVLAGSHDIAVEARAADVLRASTPDGLLQRALRTAALAVALLGLSGAPFTPALLSNSRGLLSSRWSRVLGTSLLLLLGFLVGRRAGNAVCGLAPVLLGLVLLLPWARLGARRSRIVGPVALGLVGVVAVGTAIVGGVRLSPIFGNTLWSAGFTTSGLHPQSIVVDRAMLTVLVATSLIGAMTLAVALAAQAVFTRLPVAMRLLLVTSAGMLAVTLGYALISGQTSDLYDRYLLPLLPGALALGALSLPERRLTLASLAAGVLLFAVWSVTWERDYLQRQAAVWSAANALVAQGIAPTEIDAGFEWNGWYRGETVIQQVLTELGRSGESRRFANLVVRGLYQPHEWYVDFAPAPGTCPTPPRVAVAYGSGAFAYAMQRCGPSPPPFGNGQRRRAAP